MRRVTWSLAMALVMSLAPIVPIELAPRVRVSSVGVVQGVIAAPHWFSLVGVTWPATEVAPKSVEVRTTDERRRWSGWTALELEDGEEGPDPGAEGIGIQATRPLWVSRAAFVSVRFSGRVPGGARVVLVDPGPDPRSPVLRSASAVPATPGIISRGQWGADEALRRCCPRAATALKIAFMHHTATGNAYGPGDSAAIVRSIYAYHVQAQGWDDIGYNFLVDRYGQIFEGRAGGIGRPIIGAHARGFNTGSTSVAIIGSFSSSDVPSSALNASRNLLAWRLDVEHIDPEGNAVMTSGGSDRYQAGTTVTLPVISGHRDTGNTDCPGGRLYDRLPSLRRDVAATGLPKLYHPSLNPAVFSPNGDGLRDAVSVQASVAGASSWKIRIRNQVGDRRWVSGNGSTAAFTWDGKDQKGVALGHGWYSVRIEATNGPGAARPATLSFLLAAWPNGSLLQGGSPRVYLMRGGRLWPVTSRGAFESAFGWSEIARVPDAAIKAFRTGGQLGFRDGSLIRTPDGRVWLISDGRRRHVRTRADFDRLGFSWKAVWSVTREEAQVHRLGDPVDPSAPVRPNGLLIQGSGAEVFWVQNGQRRHVPSRTVFESRFRWHDVSRVDELTLAAHALGPPVGFRDGTPVRSEDDPAVFLISDGQRRHISSRATFEALGFSWRNVRTATEAELALHPIGPAV